MQTPKPKLIYVGDPMCSWCYGIAPELDQLRQHFGDQLEYELVLGGLRPYNTETMTDLKDFLVEHWADVNKATGQPFNHEMLNKSDWLYDTEPACRASVIFRDHYENKSFDFFAAVQKAFYYENKNPADVQTYVQILKDHSWTIDDFEEKFHSTQYRNKVKADFRRAAELKVSAFPTIILEVSGKLTYISRGYRTFDSMRRIIDGQI